MESTEFRAVQMLTCTRCNRTLEAQLHFHRDKSHPTGFRSQCRDCKSKADAEYKLRKKEREQAQTVEAQKAREEMTVRQKANRNAMLRLVSNHRSEFETLVNGELLLLEREAETGVKPKGYWISAG